ncbi:hypothetical protein HDG34_004021 [Paraburkholderia sp. HC6.4b]|nr:MULTISPECIES: hypothetical protein [unclassified Paraburkholderia]MBB5410068.1 hypothetical protein [Paraburkholderia sp. HC6.4b]MBB5452017.1 hypothetical protein [Paraburkholderia sp. Kb1A]
MKRLFAIAVFVAGGFAAELAHPLQCSLIQSSGVQLKRRCR